MNFKHPFLFVFAAAILSAVALAAHPAPVLPTQVRQTMPPPRPLPIGTPHPGGSLYINPVISQNFGDPSIFRDGSTYYAYATNNRPSPVDRLRNIVCASSHDLVHWTFLPDALPHLPVWSKLGRTWAPTVRALPGGGYVAYFTAWSVATSQEEVGVGTSSSPSGPFDSPAPKPLVAMPLRGGAIDPSCFTDTDGSRYLVWKNDGNSMNQRTWIWMQRLSDDGVHLVGPRLQLITEDQPWEGTLVEAPTLWKHGGKYYLFYSANAYQTCRYAVGYAVSDSLAGPYRKPYEGPWLATSDGVCGPGGEDIVALPNGDTWMAYHRWVNGPKVSNPNAFRDMNIDRLRWDGDVPVLDGPTHTPKPVPDVALEAR